MLSLEEVRRPVLNLIINGIPSIQDNRLAVDTYWSGVLNLIINGIPSILLISPHVWKHYYKRVLNLIINGIPSILNLMHL